MAQDQYGNYQAGLVDNGISNPDLSPGGTTAVYQTSGNPEGVTTASAPAIAYDSAGGVYVKISGTGNTGWETRINPYP